MVRGAFGLCTGTRRRASAGTAVLLWVGGLYALPFAHNINHHANHTHGPPPSDHQHHHPHAHDRAEHDQDHDEPGHPKNDREPIDKDHGVGSVLHFAVAALDSQAATLPEPGPIVAPLDAPALRPADSAPAPLVKVRGPPPA